MERELPTVKTSQLTGAFDILDQVLASGRRDGDRLRGSVVIDAAPGLGKTTIATRYARDFHRRVYRREGHTTPQGHQRLPVVFVPLAAGMTPKGLNRKIDVGVLRPPRGDSGDHGGPGGVGGGLRGRLPDPARGDRRSAFHRPGAPARAGHQQSSEVVGEEAAVTFIYTGVGLVQEPVEEMGDLLLR